MKIMITTASQHGSTHEIGDEIGRVLSRALPQAEFELTICDVAAAGKLETMDGVILGSAVYLGRWLHAAEELLRELTRQASPPRIWLFSSGPIGRRAGPLEDPLDGNRLAEHPAIVDRKVFAGRLSRDHLKLRERAVVAAVRAPEGDFRDWDAVNAWAEEIASFLTRGEPHQPQE
jgi:menaquinone-dependent protoporphyrinogen oxidase